MKYGCAACAKPMERVSVPGRGRYYRCASHGLWLQRSFFHAYEGGKVLARQILGSARAGRGRSRKLACPQCFAEMSVLGYRPAPAIELDACHRCEAVWFDTGELEQIQQSTMKSAVGSSVRASPVPGEDRVRFAPSEHLFNAGGAVGLGNFSALHMLGLPTEEEVSRPQREIFLTYFLIGICLFFTLLAFKQPAALAKWAFFPLQPLKNYGLNALVSLFVHGDWLHWFSNAYFLFLAGDNIEDHVGRDRLLELFVFGGLCGHIATVFFGMKIPAVGASGAVCALLAYYVCAFPKNRLHFSWARRWRRHHHLDQVGSERDMLLGRRTYFVSLSFAPWMVFLFYFVTQILSLAFQIHREAGSHVSFHGSLNYAAHVGGILGGLLYYSAMPAKRAS